MVVQGAAPPGLTSDVSGLTREGGYVAQGVGVALCAGVMIAVLVAGLNSNIEASAALSAAQKQAIVGTLDNDVEVSVVTDATARSVAEENGAAPAVVDEIVAINGDARNDALSTAMFVLVVLALLGLLATVRIPAPRTGSEP